MVCRIDNYIATLDGLVVDIHNLVLDFNVTVYRKFVTTVNTDINIDIHHFLVLVNEHHLDLIITDKSVRFILDIISEDIDIVLLTINRNLVF